MDANVSTTLSEIAALEARQDVGTLAIASALYPSPQPCELGAGVGLGRREVMRLIVN